MVVQKHTEDRTMAFFSSIQQAPEDPILGLTKLFREDTRETKVNLGVGAYKTAEGLPLILNSVRKAESRILQKDLNHEYPPIDGLSDFCQALARTVFGRACESLQSGRMAFAQTVGASGALRMIGEFLREHVTREIYISNPTWGNHAALFSHAGLEVKRYTYYDPETRGLDFSGLCQSIREIPKGSAILFQSACHNPTGVDPTPEQWAEICACVQERGLLPIFDCAYLGFGQGIKQDRTSLRIFIDAGLEMFVAVSCSKNFGLYGERTGMLSVVSRDKEESQRVMSSFRKLMRACYSMPPIHGALIVKMILEDQVLRSEWKKELENMCGRIVEMRKALVSGLIAKSSRDFSFMSSQRGMFSYSGFHREQALRLREEFGIYMLDSGRINVAGLNSRNIDYVVEAMVAVLD